MPKRTERRETVNRHLQVKKKICILFNIILRARFARIIPMQDCYTAILIYLRRQRRRGLIYIYIFYTRPGFIIFYFFNPGINCNATAADPSRDDNDTTRIVDDRRR